MNDAVGGAMPCADVRDRTEAMGSGAELDACWVPASPPRLAFAGEVDLMTIEQFDAVLSQVGASHDRFVLDLRGLEFIGSMGIAALLRHRDQLAAIVVDEPGPAHRVLTLVGFPWPLISTTHSTQE